MSKKEFHCYTGYIQSMDNNIIPFKSNATTLEVHKGQ